MIDTDKYEGHTPAEKWAEVIWGKNPRHESKGELPTCLVMLNMDSNGEPLYATLTDQILMADAPLLLAEVKRLNMVINMLRKNDLWVSTEGWEESDKDDELLVSMHFLIDKALELRGDLNEYEGEEEE